MRSKIYGMNGTFFQEYQQPVIVHAAESEGGTHVELAHDAMSFVFSGHFMIADDGIGEGNMIDVYGASALTIQHFEPGTLLCFQKEYQRTGNVVTYEMMRQDNGLWTGHYEGVLVGSGLARCLITELTPDLFDLGPVVYPTR